MSFMKNTLGAVCSALFLSLALTLPVFGEADGLMTISDGKIISMEYTLTLEDKKVIDTNVGKDPLTFTQGSHQIIPGLETELEGMKTGETKQVTVSPEKAYGQVNPKAIQEVPIDVIPPEGRKVGMQLQGKDDQGQVHLSRVAEIKEKVIVLDFNHPLAGKTLYFDVKILDIKPAPTPSTP